MAEQIVKTEYSEVMQKSARGDLRAPHRHPAR